jgi:Flp pilus assembly protein TadG
MGTARYPTVRPLADRRGYIPSRHQRGAVGIMTVVLLPVIFGFFALALDLARIYNRKVEMQNVADVIALAAANELNGTANGVTKALAQASSRLSLGKPEGMTYQYSMLPMEWNNAAIKFNSSLAGGTEWVDAGTASATPKDMRFVKVDTSDLNPEYGEVKTLFMQILAPSLATSSSTGRAIAGPSAISVAPLALCPMRPEPAKSRSGELVEYGFRRGVSYDLMDLRADQTTPAQSFVINPLATPGTVGALPSSDLTIVKPFACTGTMAMSRVSGGALTVESPFPLGQLFTQLNSRFDTPGSPCNQYTAPPDANVKAYYFDNNVIPPTNASVSWMKVMPSGQSAAPYVDSWNNKRWTIADPFPPEQMPTGTTGPQFGPLWSYAKAAKYAASEPIGGYSTFATTDWATLYNSSSAPPQANLNYPAAGPYAATSGASFFGGPTSGKKGLRGRRVLNVALLSCPVAGNSANVVAIGKFFMTVPATSTHLWAEFAGIAPESSFASQIELHP